MLGFRRRFSRAVVVFVGFNGISPCATCATDRARPPRAEPLADGNAGPGKRPTDTRRRRAKERRNRLFFVLDNNFCRIRRHRRVQHIRRARTVYENHMHAERNLLWCTRWSVDSRAAGSGKGEPSGFFGFRRPPSSSTLALPFGFIERDRHRRGGACNVRL